MKENEDKKKEGGTSIANGNKTRKEKYHRTCKEMLEREGNATSSRSKTEEEIFRH